MNPETLLNSPVAPFVIAGLAWLGIGLFGNVATRFLRDPIRWCWPRQSRLTGMPSKLYRWLVRLVPMAAGAVVGTIPGIWPSIIPPPWGTLLGSTAGLFSLVIFHAIEKQVPLLAAAVPNRLRGWLLNHDDVVDDDYDGGV